MLWIPQRKFDPRHYKYWDLAQFFSHSEEDVKVVFKNGLVICSGEFEIIYDAWNFDFSYGWSDGSSDPGFYDNNYNLMLTFNPPFNGDYGLKKNRGGFSINPGPESSAAHGRYKVNYIAIGIWSYHDTNFNAPFRGPFDRWETEVKDLKEKKLNDFRHKNSSKHTSKHILYPSFAA